MRIVNRLNNMTKIWTKSENDYNGQVNEYNNFLEKFGNAIV